MLIAASLAHGGVPSVNVIVSDASGKAAFKGATKSDGAFATEKLQPGNYVVQFNSTNSALKGGQYSIIVVAGKKKVVANAIAGEKFLGGGVAMKVEVGTGLNIIGEPPWVFALITGIAIIVAMGANVQIARLRNLGRLQ